MASFVGYVRNDVQAFSPGHHCPVVGGYQKGDTTLSLTWPGPDTQGDYFWIRPETGGLWMPWQTGTGPPPVGAFFTQGAAHSHRHASSSDCPETFTEAMRGYIHSAVNLTYRGLGIIAPDTSQYVDQASTVALSGTLTLPSLPNLAGNGLHTVFYLIAVFQWTGLVSTGTGFTWPSQLSVRVDTGNEASTLENYLQYAWADETIQGDAAWPVRSVPWTNPAGNTIAIRLYRYIPYRTPTVFDPGIWATVP